MRWLRQYLQRRFRPKLMVILLLAVAGLAGYSVFSLLWGGPVPQAPKAVKKIHLSGARERIFHDSDSEDEDEFEKLERVWTEPTWSVPAILRQVAASKQSVVPVVVVEEHFEVLKYWFDAVGTGAIPGSGNTLIHIDGHSDGAPPRDLSLVPWFRLPANHSELANMMQSNDVFIAGSGLAGLINRFIWVWPDWDQSEHTDESGHEIAYVIAGWRTYYPRTGKPFHRLCACQKNNTAHQGPADSEEDSWQCWDDEPDKSVFGDGPMVQSMKCDAVLSGTMEIIHESRALELLKRGDWIKPEEKLLLDIDEDYFGCESSVMPLYKAGMTIASVQKLSTQVSSYLCASNVHSELIADKVFRTLVLIVRDFKANLCTGNSHADRTKCVSDFEADKTLIQMIPRISDSLKIAGIQQLLCQDTPSELILQVLLRSLFEFNITQLDALNYVGICLETAPTNFVFHPHMLHVCHGFNVPEESSVTFHLPTVEENEVRAQLLKNTLSMLPTQPNLVTVCRSVRDGYTPWAFFTSIERAVLGALESVFSGVTEQSFHFDENLLGGRLGWPERHQN